MPQMTKVSTKIAVNRPRKGRLIIRDDSDEETEPEVASSRKTEENAESSEEVEETDKKDFEVKTSSSSRDSNQTTVTKKKRRETARSNVRKVVPEPDDLWAIAGKELSVAECQTILKEAADGTLTANPIDSQYTQIKSGGKTFTKDELIARILANQTSRTIAFEMLKKKNKFRTTTPVLPKNAKLSDFWMQFYDDGPKYPGNSADSTALRSAAGIQVYKKGGGQVSTGKKSAVVERITPEFFDESLLHALQLAIAEDPEKPDLTSAERQIKVKTLLTLLSKVDDNFLNKEIDFVEEEIRNAE
jgi:hypothetical protein